MPPPVPAQEPSESENSTVYFVQQETRTHRSNQGWTNQEGEASQQPVRRALSRPLPDTAHLRAVAVGLSLIEKIGHELKRIAQVLGSGPQGPVPPKPAVPSGIWEPTAQQVSTHPPIPPRPLEPLVSPRPPWEVTETTARPGQIRRSARQQRGASPTEWRPQLEGRPRSMASGSYGSFQSISGSNVSSPLNSQFSVAQDVPSHRSVQARAAAICGPKRSLSARAFQGLAPATQQGAAPKFLWHQREAVDPLDGVILEDAQNIDLRPQSPLRQASARAGQIQVQAQKRQNGGGGPPKAFADALAQAVKDCDGRSPSELNRPQASPLSPRARESSLQRQSARTPEPPWANWPQEEANLTVQSPRETGHPSDFQREQRQAETGPRLVEEQHELRNQHAQQERYQAAASAASAASAATAGSILGAAEVIDGPEFQRRHSVATEDSSVAASERSRRRRSRREDDDGQSVSDRSRRRRRHSEDGTTSERSRRSRRSRRGDEDDASETTSQHSRRRRRRRQEEDGESQSSRRREREEEPEDGQRLERIQEESGSPSSPKESKRSQGAPPPLQARGSQEPQEPRESDALRKGKAAEAQLSMSKSCGSTALPSSPGNFSSATASSRTMPQLQAEARPEEEVLSAAEKRWQDEIDSIRRQAMRYSKGQRLRGPSITEDTMTK